MTAPDDQPTTPFSPGPPPPPPPRRRRLGSTGRVVAVAVGALVLLGAGVGVGLAVDAGGSDDAQPAMAAAHHQAGKHGDKKKNATKADPAHQDWAHKYGQDHSAMPNQPDVASATPEQRAAATDLLTRTESATAVYADVDKAKAAGFDLQASLAKAEKKRPKLADQLQKIDGGAMPAKMPMLHVGNTANRRDGKVLDPSAPETLMYAYQGHNNWKLVGVMYTANESFPQAPPDPGGPITRWHYHDKSGGGSLMMHIFFVPGNDLGQAYALTMDGK